MTDFKGAAPQTIGTLTRHNEHRSSTAAERRKGPKNRRGPRLGSGAPIGCVPVTRPRRDRVMGSSILASLSEAGGNDPRGRVSKPLPPHSLDPADRVERNPRPLVLQTKGPMRATLPKTNYIEFTGVSKPRRGLSSVVACRTGNRRPTAESASAESHLQFRNTPHDIFRAPSLKNSPLNSRGTISRAERLTRSGAGGVRLLNGATPAAWRLHECGS